MIPWQRSRWEEAFWPIWLTWSEKVSTTILQSLEDFWRIDSGQNTPTVRRRKINQTYKKNQHLNISFTETREDYFVRSSYILIENHQAIIPTGNFTILALNFHLSKNMCYPVFWILHLVSRCAQWFYHQNIVDKASDSVFDEGMEGVVGRTLASSSLELQQFLRRTFILPPLKSRNTFSVYYFKH